MTKFDKYCEEIHKYLDKELSSLELFQVSWVNVDDSDYEHTDEIQVYYNDNLLIVITIEESVYDEDLVPDINFHFDSTTLDSRFSSSSYNNFFNKITNVIYLCKKEDVYNSILYDEENLKYYLHNHPVFNKEYYNDFVEKTISKKPNLYKYCNKELLNDENKTKYKHLELANDFDLI